jgi:membrane protein DedA with SNARE-associated domain
LDLKGLGYLISSVSVLLLGAVAWPKPEDPKWHIWALMAGMIVSIMGMGVRWVSHRKDRKDIQRAAHDEPPKSDQA